jgi:YesN/AraC family two-component response regulator
MTTTARSSDVSAVAEQQPDAVHTDIRMPPSDTNEGIVAAKQIRAKHPKTGVVVLSQYVEGRSAESQSRRGTITATGPYRS